MPGRVRRIRATVTLVAVAIAGLLVFWWWEEQRINPTTDDAFVQADIMGVAARVHGPIVRVHVVDNQRVDRGDLLFEIDPRPFALAVDEATASRDLAAQRTSRRLPQRSRSRGPTSQRAKPPSATQRSISTGFGLSWRRSS